MVINVTYWVFYLVLALLQHEGELRIVPTEDRNVFKVIYRADFDWNVELSLTNEKGRKRFSTKVDKTSGFLLPINMQGESSGKFTVTITTPAYDLSESFDYLNDEDWLKKVLQVEFKKERQTVTVSSTEIVSEGVFVEVSNDAGESLISDGIPVSESTLYRVYNLKGAPARRISVRVYTNKHNVIDQSFDF